MGHTWLGILMILAIDALLIAVVAGIVLVFMWPMAGSARRHARRFADAVARGDFAGAQAAAEQAMNGCERANRHHRTPRPDSRKKGLVDFYSHVLLSPNLAAQASEAYDQLQARQPTAAAAALPG